MSIFNYFSNSVNFLSIFKLKKTYKLAHKQVDIFYIFENISDDLKDYTDPSLVPLYIAITREEALAACARLLYVKYIDHYLRWCDKHDYEPGMDNDSWVEYMDTVQGGLNKHLLSDFKILTMQYSLGDLISVFRAFSGVATLLALPTETPGEMMSFMDRGVANPIFGDTEVPLLKLDAASTQLTQDPRLTPLAKFLGCSDIGDYIGKLALVTPSSFLSSDPKTNTPAVRDIWHDAVSPSQNNTKSALTPQVCAVYQRALAVADDLLSEYAAKYKAKQEEASRNAQKATAATKAIRKHKHKHKHSDRRGNSDNTNSKK